MSGLEREGVGLASGTGTTAPLQASLVINPIPLPFAIHNRHRRPHTARPLNSLCYHPLGDPRCAEWLRVDRSQQTKASKAFGTFNASIPIQALPTADVRSLHNDPTLQLRKLRRNPRRRRQQLQSRKRRRQRKPLQPQPSRSQSRRRR